MQMSIKIKRRLKKSPWVAICPRVKECAFYCIFKKRPIKVLSYGAIVACLWNPQMEFVIKKLEVQK